METMDKIILIMVSLWIGSALLYLVVMQKASSRRFENHPLVKQGEDEIKTMREKYTRKEWSNDE